MSETDGATLGNALLILRVIRGRSQEEVAAAAGISLKILQRMERAGPGRHTEAVRRLLSTLGFSPCQLDLAAGFARRTRRAMAAPAPAFPSSLAPPPPPAPGGEPLAAIWLAEAPSGAPAAAPAGAPIEPAIEPPAAAESEPPAEPDTAAAIHRIAREAGQWFNRLLAGALDQALGEAATPDEPGAAACADDGSSAQAGPSRAAAPRHRAAAPAPAPPRQRRPTPQGDPLWGDALFVLRSCRRIRQTHLAAAAGVLNVSISAYEHGTYNPPAETLHRLLAAMGCTLAVWEDTLAFLREARASWPGSPTAADPPPLALQIESIIHHEGRAVEEMVRRRAANVIAVARFLQSREQAPRLWERLAGLSPDAQRWLVLGAAQFHTGGFCELLCEESRRAACDSADRALDLAALAVAVAVAGSAAGSATWGRRVEGYARAHLANALRVKGQLQEADAEMHRARRSWAAGGAEDPDVINEARFLHLQASLLRDLRRNLPGALALVEKALAIDRWGETPALLIGRAKVLEELGRFELAIDSLREANARLDSAGDPHQRFLIGAHLIGDLCHLERHAEARLLVPEVRRLARLLRNDLDDARVLWLEGRVAAGLHLDGEAIAKLRQAREEFVTRGIAYDAALVTLEMASVHAALGQRAEVRELARLSAPVFAAQGVHREAQMALALFCQAAEAESATERLVRQLLGYLYRARHDAALHFEAEA
jgi:transcriptional regulator with XRE-family HTH domain